METKTLSKILDFLKENPHLDVEINDIAFNLKRSGKSVEAALKKLQEQGLVTSRKSENNHIYWYALPSAPITKTIKVENISYKNINSSSSTTETKEEIEKETIPDLMSDIDKIKKENGKKKISSVEDDYQPKKSLSSEKEETNLSVSEDKRKFKLSFLKKYDISNIPISHLAIGILMGVLFVFILNILILTKFADVSKNIKLIKNVLGKDVVTSADLNKVVTEFSRKIGGVEEKICALNTQIDSLKNEVQKRETKKPLSKNKVIEKKKLK